MKTNKFRMLPGLIAGLLFLSPFAQGGDTLNTSKQELERMKQLNKHGAVVSKTDDELRRLMVGKWTTGRHEYIYKADGTWRMLPLDISTTKGTWRFENRQLIEESGSLTCIAVTPRQLVFRNPDGPYPFRYIRIE